MYFIFEVVLISELLIFNYMKNEINDFSFYSDFSQREIVRKIFDQAIFQKIETEPQLKKLLDNVILRGEGIQKVGPPKSFEAAALRSMLLADPDWKKQIPPLRELMSLFQSIFCKKDPKLFSAAKAWLQEKLFAAKEEVPSEKMRAIYVRNLLALYPFFSPEAGEEVSFEVLGKLETYIVELIPLTPSYSSSPLMAYGLIPKEKNKNIPPFLVFKGTTYPTDEGFAQSLLTDINPFAPVGGYAFQLFIKERIEKWLKKQTQNGSKVEVIGASLGGALSLQTASYLPSYIKEVHAFNSPAVTSSEVQAWNQKNEEFPEVHVYLQNNDPISSFVGSCFAPDWKIYHVYSPIEDPLQAHASFYTAHEQAFIIPGDARSLNNSLKRSMWPIAQNFLFVPLFLVGLCLFFLIELARGVSSATQFFFQRCDLLDDPKKSLSSIWS